jgi:hypothetical protein
VQTCQGLTNNSNIQLHEVFIVYDPFDTLQSTNALPAPLPPNTQTHTTTTDSNSSVAQSARLIQGSLHKMRAQSANSASPAMDAGICQHVPCMACNPFVRVTW